MPEPQTLEEIKAFLNEGSKPRITPIPGSGNAVTNETGIDEDITSNLRRETLIRNLPKGERFVLENKQDNPLNIESGLSTWLRVGLSAFRKNEDKVAHLSKTFGPENVRMAKDGNNIIVTTVGDDGNPEDVLVDEIGFDPAGDIADFANTIPQILGGIAGLKRGKGIPKLKDLAGKSGLLRDLFTSAAGSQIAGGATDVGARAIIDQPIDLGEIGKARLEEGALEVGFGGALGVAGKVFRRAVSPLGAGRGLKEINMKAAAERVAADTGEQIKFTLGEETGSPMVQKLESIVGEVPGGGPLMAEKKAANESIRRVQRELAGGDAAIADPSESVGQAALDILRKRSGELVNAPQATRDTLQGEATKEVLRMLELPGAAVVSGPSVAKSLETAAKNSFQKFRTERDDLWNEAKQLAGGGKPTLISPSLTAKAEALLKNSLRVRGDRKAGESTEALADLLGVSAPIANKKGEQVLKSFVSPEAERALQDLVRLGKAKEPMVFDELMDAKQMVDRLVKGTSIAKGVKDKKMIEVSNLLSETIEEGLEQLNDGGAAREAFDAARDHFAKNRPQFDFTGVKDLLKEPFDTPNAFFDKMLSDKDAFINVRNLLGPDSPEFKALKLGVRNKLFQRSLDIDKDLVNAPKLLNEISEVARNNTDPTVRKDILGPNAAQLISDARALKGALPENSKIDIGALESLMANQASKGFGKGSVFKQIRQLVEDQKQLDKEFKVGVLGQIEKGTLGPRDFQSDRFVSTLWNDFTPEQVQQTMALLSHDPVTKRRVQNKVVQDILNRAQTSGVGDAAIGADPTILVSGAKLGKLINTDTSRRNLLSILGDDNVAVLDDFLTVLNGKESTFGSKAGGIAGSMAMLQFARNALSATARATQMFVLSRLMTTPGIRKIIRNGLMNQQNAAATMTAFIGSAPFVEDMINEFGEGGARRMMAGIHDSIGQWVSRSPEENEGPALDAP